MKKIIALIILAIIIVGAIVLVATHQSSKSPTTQPMTSTSTKTTNSAVATDSITIQSYAFTPANITVKQGTTVTWTNKDQVAHTVTETDGKTGPSSGDINQNQSYSFTFNQAGTFKYDCSIHTYMVGTVTVTD